MRFGPFRFARLARRQFLLAVATLIVRPKQGFSAKAEDQFREDCTKNLRVLFEAIHAFRRRYRGDYPSTLSQLHPEFIADIQRLSCPVARKSGNFEFGSPKFRNSLSEEKLTSYNYDLTSRPATVKPINGRVLTNREFKFLQRETPVGDNVPIVRCSNKHGSNGWLNLPFSGRVYLSAPFWEIQFRHLMPHPYLIPEAVLLDTRPIPQRIAKPGPVSPEMVDLSAHYNGCLADFWVWGKGDPPLGELLRHGSQGIVRLGDHAFDARGVIQVDAAVAPEGVSGFKVPMFPTEVAGVPLRGKAKRLLLLTGTVFPEMPGRVVATVRVDYASTHSESFQIRYGVDVIDALAAGANDRSARPVWTNSAGRGCLFIKEWRNPRAWEPMAAISFQSALSLSAPFFLAVTLKR